MSSFLFYYVKKIINFIDISNYFCIIFTLLIISKNSSAENITLDPNKYRTTKTCCFDLIIIGGGSAAFSAAKTASKLGKKILLYLMTL